MHIIIAYESGEPIYEQIKSQIRGQILGGNPKEGTMLPSIRTLAKELRIGVVTAKRAYDDLCDEGFLYSVPGKGVFVAAFSENGAKSYAVETLKDKFQDIKRFAETNSVSLKKIDEIYKEIFGD